MTDQVEILLVEDNPNDVELALHALRRHNLANAVHVVRDGAEALDFMFCRGPYGTRTLGNPKVILLDLKLPKIGGIEVLRSIRADPRTSRVPVVVLTSSREERDVVDSYQLAANSYVTKPMDWEQFTESIRQIGMYWLVVNQPPPMVVQSAADDSKAAVRERG